MHTFRSAGECVIVIHYNAGGELQGLGRGLQDLLTESAQIRKLVRSIRNGIFISIFLVEGTIKKIPPSWAQRCRGAQPRQLELNAIFSECAPWMCIQNNLITDAICTVVPTRDPYTGSARHRVQPLAPGQAFSTLSICFLSFCFPF